MSRHGEPTIALLHAGKAAMAPAEAALREVFPDAQFRHVLDESLFFDLDGLPSELLKHRFLRLLDHVAADGCDAVLSTCSVYGPLVAHHESPVPVLAPFESMVREVFRRAPSKVGILGWLQGSNDVIIEELSREAANRQVRCAEVESAVVPGAKAASESSDVDRLEELLCEAATPMAKNGVELLLIAQYTMSIVDRSSIERCVGIPCLTPPSLAAVELLARLDTSEV